MLSLHTLASITLGTIAHSAGLAEPGRNGSEERLDPERQWAQWRGPLGTGFAPHADPPVRWSERENVRWKVPLPGQGHSTPAVWGERLFVTAAIPVGDALEPAPETAQGAHDNAPVTHRQQFVVMAIDRATGGTLWTRVVNEELPQARAHVSGTFASGSPVTDGENVFAFFGSYGVACVDLHGELVWSADLGQMDVKHAHGEGSSPALYAETLVVNWDHEGESFVVAFDKRTGEERWRAERNEVTSWASPIIVDVAGEPQAIVAGSNRIRGYELATGKVIWECAGLSHNVVATPLVGDGILYSGSSYEKQAMLALQLEGARGDLGAGDKLLWLRRRNTPYVPSPLLLGDSLYFLRHYQGILCEIDIETGADRRRPLRLEQVYDVYASPVGARDRIYVVDREGNAAVLRAGGAPELLAHNRLDDGFSASPALVGRELFLRGHRFLYCIAEQDGD